MNASGRWLLHNRPGSGGFAVEAALTLAGAEFDVVLGDSKPGTPNPESFRAVNPWNQVPVLVTPGGTTLTESAAILAHLSLVFPGLGPAPGTDAHGTMLRWLVFMSVNLYEPTLRRVLPQRYTADEAGLRGVRAAAKATLAAAFGLLEAELAGRAHLVGGARSVADLYLAMLNAWAGAGRGFAGCDALTHAVAADPRVAPVWSRNFDHWLPDRWGRTG